MKYIFLAIILFFSSLTSASEISNNQNSELTTLFSYALKNSPEINKLKHEYSAQKKYTTSAYFPPDPVLSFNSLNIPGGSYDFDKSAMSARQIAVKQTIPFPSKLIKQASIENSKSLIKKIQVEMLTLNLKLAIRNKYHEIATLKKLINHENNKLKQLNAFFKIAKTKYKLREISDRELTNISIEISKVKSIRLSLENEKLNSLELLKSLVSTDNIFKNISFKFIREESYSFELNKIKSLSLKKFPLINIKREELKKNSKIKALAKDQFLPDIFLGGAYNIRDNNLPDGGKDSYSFSVGISVPVFAAFKQAPRYSAKKELENAAKSALNETSEKITYSINRLYNTYHKYLEQIELYKNEIIPHSKRRLKRSIKEYQINLIPYSNVLNNLISLFNYYSKLEDFRLKLEQTAALLEYYQVNI